MWRVLGKRVEEWIANSMRLCTTRQHKGDHGEELQALSVTARPILSVWAWGIHAQNEFEAVQKRKDSSSHLLKVWLAAGSVSDHMIQLGCWLYNEGVGWSTYNAARLNWKHPSRSWWPNEEDKALIGSTSCDRTYTVDKALIFSDWRRRRDTILCALLKELILGSVE